MALIAANSQDNPFTAPILVNFLIRVIVDSHHIHSNPNIVGLVNFNTLNLSYIPTELIRQISDIAFLNFNIYEQSNETERIQYASILVHAFSPYTQRPKKRGDALQKPTIQTEVLSIMEGFKVFGKEKKIIVLINSYLVKPSELDLLAKTYHYFGAIDIIYVLIKEKELVVIRLNDLASEFVELAQTAKIGQLFPDRLSNLSGRPYKVACIENPPMSYRNPSTNRTIGIDVEFIDMIAKHQHTVVEYRYTPRPIELFNPWHSTEFDFATYRIVMHKVQHKIALLFMPNPYRWCLAVPKTYNRVLHAQMLWPYTTDLWLLIVAIVTFFLLYNLFLKSALERRHPNAYPIVNTPLHIMRILLLFLLSEYYTALLSSNLGLSKLPAYPRTLAQFKKSTVPLIVDLPESFTFLRNNPNIMSRTISWNFSQRYDPTQLAVIQLCDLFPYSIRFTTRRLGKELNYHNFHLIDEPVRCIINMSPFRLTSPLLVRFQMYVRRLNEAGIWDFLVRKWTSVATNSSDTDPMDTAMLKSEHFVPVYIVGGYLYMICIVVLLLEIIWHRIVLHINAR